MCDGLVPFLPSFTTTGTDVTNPKKANTMIQ